MLVGLLRQEEMMLELKYIIPATAWEETLPIGNGSLGAMIWGGMKEETLGLNEESIWSGYYKDKNRPEAKEYLGEVRQLVLSGKYKEAQEVAQNHLLGEYNESYLPLGKLKMQFFHQGEGKDYVRRLDIEKAMATISYQIDGVNYQREYFASYPHKAIFARLTANQAKLHVGIRLETELQAMINTELQEGYGKIRLHAQCPEHVDPSYLSSERPVIQGSRGMQVEGTFELLYTDGQAYIEDDILHIEKATEIICSFWAVKQPNYGEVLNGKIGYEKIVNEHQRDYQKLFSGTELYLGEQCSLPTDERLNRLKAGEEDNGLYALYFQYGRYLLISSSRPGSLPANLQGIWSWEFRAPWSSNWTTNINTQMNYWPALSCNLAECLEPYFSFVQMLCEEGKKTAKDHYGVRGSCHHHNADYWCNTNPVGIAYDGTNHYHSAIWGLWPMGLAWLTADEFFKYFEYTNDTHFLKETAYPILRENVLFLLDWMFEHNGTYSICPSTSPENLFFDQEGNECCVGMNSAMDLELIRDIFGQFMKTCEILDLQDELIEEIKERLEKLPPFLIGSEGQLLEYSEEFREVDAGHRHISHLYGLFPSEVFAGDEVMTEAVRKSLERRLQYGGGHTGWSCAWIINMFAILEDSEKAYDYLHTLLVRSTYPNLWDAHPPFQIDGNFGGTAGIANMLVQDRKGELKILPALPKAFKNGYVKGLRIKNGKLIDIAWENSKEVTHKIYDCNED